MKQFLSELFDRTLMYALTAAAFIGLAVTAVYVAYESWLVDSDEIPEAERQAIIDRDVYGPCEPERVYLHPKDLAVQADEGGRLPLDWERDWPTWAPYELM